MCCACVPLIEFCYEGIYRTPILRFKEGAGKLGDSTATPWSIYLVLNLPQEVRHSAGYHLVAFFLK